jgi:hypothetical protein
VLLFRRLAGVTAMSVAASRERYGSANRWHAPRLRAEAEDQQDDHQDPAAVIVVGHRDSLRSWWGAWSFEGDLHG